MSVFTDMAAMPLNSFVIALNTLIFLWHWNRRETYEHLAISYRRIVLEKQFYRIITATFSHLDFMHIIFNMGSLYQAGALESMLGSAWYAETTLLLIAVIPVMWLSVTHLLITRFNKPEQADASAVGYSGVLFGWFTLMALAQPNFRIPLPFGFSLPIVLAPFASLLFTQLIIRKASFLGHLSGILAGFVVGGGLLNWLRGYWITVFSLWWCVVCLLSLRANSGLHPWIARHVYVSPEYCSTTMAASLVDNDSDTFGTVLRRFMVNGVLRVSRPVAREQLIDITGPGGHRVAAANSAGGAAAVRPAGRSAASTPRSPPAAGAPTSGAGAQPVPLSRAAPTDGLPRLGQGAEIELPSRTSAPIRRNNSSQRGLGEDGGSLEEVNLLSGGSGGGSGSGLGSSAQLPLMAARAGPGPTSSASASGGSSDALGSSRAVHGTPPRRSGAADMVGSPGATGSSSGGSSGLSGLFGAVAGRLGLGLDRLGMGQGARPHASPAPTGASATARPDRPAPQRKGAGREANGQAQAGSRGHEAVIDEEEGEGDEGDERQRLI